MRTSRRHRGARSVLCTIALVASTWLGCTQGEGESCQLDSDCDDGLRCQRGTAASRGICIDENADIEMPNEGGAPDAPLNPDDAGPDAGRDAGPDAGRDAGADAGFDAGADAGAIDAGSVDSGGPDAASEMDSGS